MEKEIPPVLSDFLGCGGVDERWEEMEPWRWVVWRVCERGWVFVLDVASLERGLMGVAAGVLGRETLDGGSEERESMTPAILRMSWPTILRSAMIMGSWLKE